MEGRQTRTAMLVFGLFLLTIIFGANGEATNSKQTDWVFGTERVDTPILQLTARIVNTKYSIGKSTQFETERGVVSSRSHTTFFTRLHFSLELKFTNTSKQPIMLYKKSDLQPAWGISRDHSAALAKEYEIYTEGHFISVEEFRRVGWRDDEPKQNEFVILRSGESYTVERNCIVRPYGKEGQKLTGEHYLQVWVQTWYYNTDAQTYRKKWGEKGYLWSDPLTPGPLVFTIEN